MVREKDVYGEHPHIYVKTYTETGVDGETESLMVINDTGVGTRARDTSGTTWTIKSFIEAHLGLNSKTTCLVILSHCHYDHILGLHYLRSGSDKIVIVSSGRDRKFVTPYEVLNKHSLCEYYHLKAPDYAPDIWADDEQLLIYTTPKGTAIQLGITVLHTPGHTPDSLSWYDAQTRTVYVGDSFYQRTSEYSQSAPWGPEAPAPIIFPLEGDVVEWWDSLDKLLRFVENENKQTPLVTLCAGHVTAQVDAHEFLIRTRAYMVRILKGEVPFRNLPEREGQQMGHWDDSFEERYAEFSLIAPIRLIEEARTKIPEIAWECKQFGENRP